MINKPQLLQRWDHIRQTHGIALRAIAALPADQLDSHPIPKMRTPKELVIHMYDAVIKDLVEGVARGEVVLHKENEKKCAASIKSRDELIQYARDTWNGVDRVVSGITDGQLNAIVKTPFGMDLPGSPAGHVAGRVPASSRAALRVRPGAGR